MRELRAEWSLFRSRRMGQAFLLVLLLVVVYQSMVQRAWVDTGEYLRKAQSMFDGWLPVSGDRMLEQSRRTPAFGLWLMLLGPLYTLVSGLACLLFVLNLRIWVRRLSSYQHAADWATLFVMLHPLTWVYAVVPMPELWCMILFLGWLRGISASNGRSLSIHSAVLLALKPVFVLLVPFGLLAVFWLPGFKNGLKSALWVVLGPLLVYSATWLYHAHTMGVGHYSSVGISNALEYNLPAYQDGFRYQEVESDPAQTLAQSQRIIRTTLVQQALPAALVHLRGLGVGLLDPGRYDLWAFWGATGDMGIMKALNQRRWPPGATVAGLIYLCIGLAVNAAFLLVIMQGWLSQKRYRQHVFFALLCLCWLGIVGPVASARYTLILYPLFSLWFAEGWLHRFSSRG